MFLARKPMRFPKRSAGKNASGKAPIFPSAIAKTATSGPNIYFHLPIAKLVIGSGSITKANKKSVPSKKEEENRLLFPVMRKYKA